MAISDGAVLRETPLSALHRSLGGKMVPFAGYVMPLHFAAGILKEHLHTRAAAGLFDVSHMGQVALRGDGATAALEALVPGDILGLREGRMRYTLLTNERAGIIDDLIVSNAGDRLNIVVNAACKAGDIRHLRAGLPNSVTIEPLEDRALLALQGPLAATVLQRLTESPLEKLAFMSCASMRVAGIGCTVSRSGYTGEDGFEISVAAEQAEGVALAFLDQPEVEPIGLGARDTLRLEAGLCLYGHDIDQDTTPVEARLTWSIGKRRREEGGFPGDAILQRQLRDGSSRYRVGIRPEGRAPAREGTEVVDAEGGVLGRVTSGGFGPSVGAPVAMGYVAAGHHTPGTSIQLVIRGKTVPAVVAALPFVEQRYYRG